MVAVMGDEGGGQTKRSGGVADGDVDMIGYMIVYVMEHNCCPKMLRW